MKKNVTNFSGNLMKILSLTIVLAFIAPLMTNAQAGKANFAGTWTYNAEKSTQPAAGAQGGQRMGGGNLVATQEANLLTVETTRTGQDGTPQKTTVKYTLDGKESVNTNPRGDSKSVATWSADGKSLSIATTRTTDNGEMKSSEVWTLTAPKVLSIAAARQGQDGEVKTTRIYEIK